MKSVPFRHYFSRFRNWPPRWLLLVLAPICALGVILPNAWIAEDAFITLRVAKNIVHGYGPVWNLDDRVQVFTHPLWMILLTATQWLFPHDTPAAVIWLCILVSLTAIVLFLRDITSRWVLVVAVILMLSSMAFVEYATSGLENPLLYVLVVLFAHEYLGKQRTFQLSLIASLAAVTRADAAALVLPTFLPLIYRHWRNRLFWLDVLKGMIPLLAWESFSLTYYGYLLPNTVYAKTLTTYIPEPITSLHAYNYFANSLGWDNVTLPLIVITLIVTDLERANRRRLWLAAGIVLYLLAVFKAGGDYMSGRFFAVPFFLALYLFARWLQSTTKLPRYFKPAVVVLALGLAVVTPKPPITDPLTKQLPRSAAFDKYRSDVSDNGQYLCPYTCLYNLSKFKPALVAPWAVLPPGQYPIATGIGIAGYYAKNPYVHVVDQLGLGDPLLSHLPASASSNVGQFIRLVPAGYVGSLKEHRNLIKDLCIHRLYSDIEPVVTGPLFSVERFKKIIKLNLGISDREYQQCAKIGTNPPTSI